MSKQTAFLTWQDPDSRDWHVIGVLNYENDQYSFRYTQGCKNTKNFVPFSGMDNLTKEYRSFDLFPVFQNRLLSSKRPEFPKFISWLGLDSETANSMDLLTRSGGVRGTDNLQLFPKVDLENDGHFEHVFFVHGGRYLSESSQKRIHNISSGDNLYPCLDVQNEFDKNAILLRTNNLPEVLGYVPRYLSLELSEILRERPETVVFSVDKISSEAPESYKLLCRVKGKIPPESKNIFMASDEYLPLTN
ncbi:HIRAN domain-containing protein [Marinomonas sp. FW-1]|uniref:HIRAN domain-containing protein n=1 Tax=Marinomonas sp. FW-1 TaxID=2071621 RepID=UPI0010C022CE|nr:HIRAN domain-containing protein [Marinomonas sp. FW-1]